MKIGALSRAFVRLRMVVYDRHPDAISRDLGNPGTQQDLELGPHELGKVFLGSHAMHARIMVHD